MIFQDSIVRAAHARTHDGNKPRTVRGNGREKRALCRKGARTVHIYNTKRELGNCVYQEMKERKGIERRDVGGIEAIAIVLALRFRWWIFVQDSARQLYVVCFWQ